MIEPTLPAGEDDADANARRFVLEAEPHARILVDAPPGAGKTQLAAQRLGGLIGSKLSPGQVLVLSFSRSAVRTLTKRLATLSDPHIVEELRHVSIRTFDSWAFRMLRLMGATPEALLAQSYDQNIAAVTALMKSPKAAELRERIGKRRHIIVDEFQDLPGVRGELVLALLNLIATPGSTETGFTILGDPAQAIFGFAGRNDDTQSWPSAGQYWKRVIDEYGAELKVARLTRNFRAGGAIAALSSEMRAILTSDLSEAEKLAAVSARFAGVDAAAAPLDPAWLAGETGGSRAILTRTNGEAVAVMRKLFGQGLQGWSTPLRMRAANYVGLPPAWIAGLLNRYRGRSLARSQFETIYSKLTGVWDEAQRRALELPAMEVAWSRLARASGAAEDADAITIADVRAHLFWPDAFPDDQNLADDGLIITTIHQSKGMEFDVVTILETSRDEDGAEADEAGGAAAGANSGDAAPRKPPPRPGALEEEANVSYVGVTRASHELARLPADAIYAPLYRKKLDHGRERFFYWRNFWMNMEIGCRGDVDPLSFADSALHGAEGVAKLQAYLLANARALEGRKVILQKTGIPKANGEVQALYDIRLQEERGVEGLLIGRTTPQLTYDLFELVWNKGFHLPSLIFNLRISGVGSLTADVAPGLVEPERTSRLWLGVGLFGTGDFQPKKRGGR